MSVASRLRASVVEFMRAPGVRTTSKDRIISLSSCTRLWQWNMYSPRWGPNLRGGGKGARGGAQVRYEFAVAKNQHRYHCFD